MKKIALLLFSVMLGSLSAWSIAETEKNNPAADTGAKELKHYLSLCVSDIILNGKSAIFHLGNTAKAKKLGVNTAKLADDEWVIKTDRNDVVIAGGGRRGTLYGVYIFIEKYLGVRYFNAYEEYIYNILKVG